MEAETVPTLDEARTRRSETRRTVTLETIGKDLEGQAIQLEMYRDGLWRNLDAMADLRRDVKALTISVNNLVTMAAVTEVQIAALCQRERAPRYDLFTRILSAVLVGCVVLIALKQVGAL